jgi:hypothetical protein
MTDEKKIFILQKIEDFRNEEESFMVSGNIRERMIIRRRRESESSVNIISKFQDACKELNLNAYDLKNYELFNETETRYLKFFYENRMKMKIEDFHFSKVVKLDEENRIFLIFNPECSNRFIYKFFMFFVTTPSELQNSLMKFLNFKSERNLENYLEIPELFEMFIDLSSKKQIISQFINLFEFNAYKLDRLILDYQISKDTMNTFSILLGNDDVMMSLRGPIQELRFLVQIKEYLAKVL